MKVLTTIDLLALPNLETPPTGHVGFGAKSDGLYQKVGTVETKLSIDGHTHTIAQITGLQGVLDSKATHSDISTAVNNLQIGGRNLYLKSQTIKDYQKGSDHGNGNSWSNIIENGIEFTRIVPVNNGNFYFWPRLNVLPFTIYAGEQYTISFKYRTSQASSTGLYNYLLAPGVSATIPANSEWSVFSKTYTVAADKTVTGNQLFGFSSLVAGTQFDVRDFKLEKGNKATDWTPAPEDVQAAIDKKLSLSGGTLTGNLTAPTFIGALSGNAGSATKLQTARQINGVNFDGSANITITAATPQTLTRGSYLTGSNFNGSSATTWAVDATSANTVNKVVARDASGNFSAGTITAALSGNASTATKLSSARTLALTGDISGSVSSDLNAGFSIATTLANSGVTAGTYKSVTVNAKGLVTAGTNPTTLAGYGITDAAPISHSNISGETTIHHTHSNKAIINQITQANLDVLSKLSLVNGVLQISVDAYSTGELSAYGAGTSTTVLTDITITGTGNAVTLIEKSGSILTITKGLTFALDSKFQFVTALPATPDPNTYYFIQE